MAAQEFTAQELENEEWRPIPGFEARYSASTLGRIRGHIDRFGHGPRLSILKPRFNKRGPYYQINLSRGGRNNRQTFTVHRLIALTFLGPRPQGLQINHKDGRKLNNRLINLEYATARENTQHAIRLGLFNPATNPKGSRWGHGAKPKLEQRQVVEARVRHQHGESCAAIGRSLGVSDRTICDVVHRAGAYKL